MRMHVTSMAACLPEQFMYTGASASPTEAGRRRTPSMGP